MNTTFSRTALFSLVLAFCLPVTFVANAQENSKPTDAPAKAASKDTGKAEKAKRKRPRGRLPNYYSRVVDEAQREKIYGIQSKYAEEIEALAAQIAELVAQRNAEVEAVLTPEQLDEVKKITAEAIANRRRGSTKAAEPDSDE